MKTIPLREGYHDLPREERDKIQTVMVGLPEGIWDWPREQRDRWFESNKQHMIDHCDMMELVGEKE